jgi:hypothetical protein
MFQPLTLLRSNTQTYKCSMIVTQFCHEFSASTSPPLSPQQTRVDSASDDYSDFPPIRALKTPDPSSRCSPVARRQSEWQFRQRHPPNSVAQRWSEQLSSPSKAPAPFRSHRHLPNSGLGNWNRLNTMEASVSVSVRHSKVRCQTLTVKQLY